jgi:lysophospholipase L1-like esterase
MFGILCFGDSITWGRGELPNKGWVGRLKEKIEQEAFSAVYNLGICGETSAGLLGRLPVEYRARTEKKREADAFFTIVATGMNDVGRGVSEEAFSATIEKIAAFLPSSLFLGITPFSGESFEGNAYPAVTIARFNEIIAEKAKQHGHQFLAFEGMDDTMLADGLHPNERGYQFMFEKISSLLSSLFS